MSPLATRRALAASSSVNSQAKLPAVRLHDLRHGAAVMGLEAGLNLELVDTLAAMLTATQTAAA